MNLAAALILAASAPSQAAPAGLPPPLRGASAQATVSVTIVAAARVRLADNAGRTGDADGSQPAILTQRRQDGRRVLVEFN